jgi:hypothetical protein
MTTRWILSLQAIDPRTSPVDPSQFWTVGIPKWLYRKHQNSGHDAPLARIVLVGELLAERTEQIWKGWSRPGKDECYAYCGVLSREFKSPEIQTPPPPGMTFVVFVLPDGSIDDWTWRRLVEDEGGLSRPEGVKGELIWPLTEQKTKSRSS